MLYDIVLSTLARCRVVDIAIPTPVMDVLPMQIETTEVRKIWLTAASPTDVVRSRFFQMLEFISLESEDTLAAIAPRVASCHPAVSFHGVKSGKETIAEYTQITTKLVKYVPVQLNHRGR